LLVTRELKVHRPAGRFSVTSEIVFKRMILSFETCKGSIFTFRLLNLILYHCKLTSFVFMYIFRIVSETY